MFKKLRSNSIWRLWASARELVASWWQVDRVRVSPRQGRLLRVTTGSMLSVRGSVIEVVQRVVRETSRGPLVCYETRGLEGQGELWIAPESFVVIVWICDGCEHRLMADEVEVWGHDQR